MLATETATAELGPAPEAPAFSPAAEAQARWERHLASRVKTSPWTSTRASGIGDPCERRIYYRRTAGEHEKPYSPELQAIFDLGNHLEGYAVRKLEDLGFEVVQRGKDWQDPALEITGHVDALLRGRGWPIDVPTEINGLNDFTHDSIERIDDIRHSPSPWVRRYYSQLQKYLDFEKKPLGLFALLGKGSGQFRFIDCPFDPEHVATLNAKAARVRDAVRAQVEPPRNELEGECDRCPFAHLCMPDRVFGPGTKILEAPPPELLELLERREELEDGKREFDRIDKRLKAMLPEGEELLVGDWVIEGKKQHRDGYTVKATEFWVRKFRRMAQGATH